MGHGGAADRQQRRVWSVAPLEQPVDPLTGGGTSGLERPPSVPWRRIALGSPNGSFDREVVLVSEFPAIAHVAVTVSDLDRSRPWYQRLFDADPVMDEDAGSFHHVVWLLGGTLFSIHHHPAPSSSAASDELRPGLDHVAFGCADRAELESWEERLNDLGITHGGIIEAPYGSALSFRDPDNIALEFFAPPG
jgi:glyoxylase I family protein